MKKLLFLLFFVMIFISPFSEMNLEEGIDVGKCTTTPLVIDIDDDDVYEFIIVSEKHAGAVRLIEGNGEEPWHNHLKIGALVHNRVNYFVKDNKKFIIYADLYDDATEKNVLTVYCYDQNRMKQWSHPYPKDYIYFSAPIWDVVTRKIYFSITTSDSSRGLMSVLDMDGNELFSKKYSSGITSRAIIKDIDVDGEKELIYKTDKGELEVLDNTYSKKDGFPFKAPKNAKDCFYDIGVHDVNGDRYKEIVYGSGYTGKQYFWIVSHKGKMMKEISISEKCKYAPEFLDIDNDGTDEVILASIKGNIYVKDLDNKDMQGWPVRAGSGTVPGDSDPRLIIGKPILLDIDLDGISEIVVAAWAGSEYKLKAYGVDGTEKDLDISLGKLGTHKLSDYFAIADYNKDGKLDVIYIDDTKFKVQTIDIKPKIKIEEIFREYKFNEEILK